MMPEYVSIKNGKVIRNGDVFFSAESADFLKLAYQSLGIDYPKFYKMDILAQLGFLCLEFLNLSSVDHQEAEIAQLFANRSSSLHTDIRFQQSYLDHGSPSPSLFVYTLPNIVSGELAIRHKLFGESHFYILSEPDPDFYSTKCKMMLDDGYKAVICGWVEADASAENASGFVFFVTPENVGHISDIISLFENQ